LSPKLLKFAVMAMLFVVVTLQSLVPLQPPLQPEKTDPDSGIAFNETRLPLITVVEQVVPQSIPVVVLETLPLPCFDTVTVTAFRMNFAVHILLAFIVTEPSLQSVSPVHPANLEFAPATGDNVITLPDA
jgi:hypothetical protein